MVALSKVSLSLIIMSILAVVELVLILFLLNGCVSLGKVSSKSHICRLPIVRFTDEDIAYYKNAKLSANQDRKIRRVMEINLIISKVCPKDKK